MNFVNDRTILVLLQLKERKTICEKRRISFLKMKYPDNEVYRDRIINDLNGRGLINYWNTCLDLFPTLTFMMVTVHQEW